MAKFVNAPRKSESDIYNSKDYKEFCNALFGTGDIRKVQITAVGTDKDGKEHRKLLSGNSDDEIRKLIPLLGEIGKVK
jgi:hypothetical protein